MNTADKVNKVMSMPMLAINVVLAVIDFKNGNVFLGVCLLLYGAWWALMVYKYFILKKP